MWAVTPPPPRQPSQALRVSSDDAEISRSGGREIHQPPVRGVRLTAGPGEAAPRRLTQDSVGDPPGVRTCDGATSATRVCRRRREGGLGSSLLPRPAPDGFAGKQLNVVLLKATPTFGDVALRTCHT